MYLTLAGALQGSTDSPLAKEPQYQCILRGLKGGAMLKSHHDRSELSEVNTARG